MDYDLIVVKTLERVYKNYYYIIRGENITKFVFDSFSLDYAVKAWWLERDMRILERIKKTDQ